LSSLPPQTPFGVHVYPWRPMASFDDVNADEIADLARVLRTVLGKLYIGLPGSWI